MKIQSPEMEKWNDDGPDGEYRIADYDARSERIRRAVLGDDLDSEAYWDRLRNMSKSEGWRLTSRMTQMFFDEVRAEIKAEHPQWNQQEQNIELVARMYGPTLAGRYRRYIEKRSTNEHSD